MGLVPATSRRAQSHRVNWQLVPATSCRDQSHRANCFKIQSQRPTLVPATSPTNSNQFDQSQRPNFGPCDQILWQKWPVHTIRLVPATCCRDQSQGLVLSCVLTLMPCFGFLSVKTVFEKLDLSSVVQKVDDAESIGLIAIQTARLVLLTLSLNNPRQVYFSHKGLVAWSRNLAQTRPKV